MDAIEKQVPLGGTELCISPMGLGAWQWGDRSTWSYGSTHHEADVRASYQASIAAGINFIDTAELYGTGVSERLLGKFLKDPDLRPSGEADFQPVIATKFFPMPYRWTKSAFRRALKGSLRRLQLDRVDLYQIHFPFPPVPYITWVEALADACADGLARAAGVSNFDLEQTLRSVDLLEQRGLRLASNQVPYHLLNRKAETSGLLEECRRQGITLIAYSPLAQGALTGKYTPEKPMGGIRGRRYSRSRLAEVRPLVERMRSIGQNHGGKSPAQVAINWVICKGAVPIPGAKNGRQAIENAGALGWRLDPDEVAELDALSAPLQPGSR